MRWSRRLVGLLAAVSAAVAGAATPTGWLVELGRLDLSGVQALEKRVQAQGGWWLELESQLLVVAAEDRLPDLVRGLSVSHQLGPLTPESLALEPRGCSDHDTAPLPAIAMAGRYALVRAPRRFVPYPTPDSAAWRAVTPNTVLARDQSVRGPPQRKQALSAAASERVSAVDTARWFSAVQMLASFDRSSYSTGIDSARDWLVARFDELDLDPQLHTFAIDGSVSVENVIATRSGAALPDEWIIIGAHYDARNSSSTAVAGTPGAEDNASGCAGVLELARVYAAGPPAQRTLKFVCFAGEEQGLLGSSAWVQQLASGGQLARVQYVLIMDMVGYSGDTDLDVLLETSAALDAVFDPFIALQPQAAPELRLVTSTQPFGSDHMPFIQRNVPTLLTIENDWNSYPHYHRSTDVPANMTRAHDIGGAILRLSAAVLAQVAVPVDGSLFASGFE